jgi:hypothetical protein
MLGLRDAIHKILNVKNDSNRVKQPKRVDKASAGKTCETEPTMNLDDRHIHRSVKQRNWGHTRMSISSDVSSSSSERDSAGLENPSIPAVQEDSCSPVPHHGRRHLRALCLCGVFRARLLRQIQQAICAFANQLAPHPILSPPPLAPRTWPRIDYSASWVATCVYRPGSPSLLVRLDRLGLYKGFLPATY